MKQYDYDIVIAGSGPAGVCSYQRCPIGWKRIDC